MLRDEEVLEGGVNVVGTFASLPLITSCQDLPTEREPIISELCSEAVSHPYKSKIEDKIIKTLLFVIQPFKSPVNLAIGFLGLSAMSV
jgi:hypothetical protein